MKARSSVEICIIFLLGRDKRYLRLLYPRGWGWGWGIKENQRKRKDDSKKKRSETINKII